MTTEAFGIWCRVSGGVTGTREAWAKRDGAVLHFYSLEAAEREAAGMRDRMGRNSVASFSYEARRLSP